MAPGLPALVAFGVLSAAITSLVVLWSLFFTMWLQGEPSIHVTADTFGEFAVELVGLTLAVVFLPVLLYELDRLVFGRE